MTTESMVAALDGSVVQSRRFANSTILSDYWALTKPEVNFLIVVATFAGFCLGCRAPRRDDYDRAGYLVMPHGHARTRFVTLQTLLPLLALVPLSLLPALTGPPSAFYCIGALLLSLGFFYYAANFVLRRGSAAARRLLLASIIYLPSLLALMIVFRR